MHAEIDHKQNNNKIELPLYNAHQCIHTTIARVVVAAFDSKTAAIDTNIFTVCLSLFLLFCKTVKFNAPWAEIYNTTLGHNGLGRGPKGAEKVLIISPNLQYRLAKRA